MSSSVITLLYTSVCLFPTSFSVEDITVHTGKLSDPSVLKIAVLKLAFINWFIRVWSIAVAVFLITHACLWLVSLHSCIANLKSCIPYYIDHGLEY